jgi:hypothetical protein
LLARPPPPSSTIELDLLLVSMITRVNIFIAASWIDFYNEAFTIEAFANGGMYVKCCDGVTAPEVHMVARPAIMRLSR